MTIDYAYYKAQLAKRRRTLHSGHVRYLLTPEGDIQFMFNAGHTKISREKLPWVPMAKLAPNNQLTVQYTDFATGSFLPNNALVRIMGGEPYCWTSTDASYRYRLRIGVATLHGKHAFGCRRRYVRLQRKKDNDPYWARGTWELNAPLVPGLTIDLAKREVVHLPVPDDRVRIDMQKSQPVYEYVRKCGDMFDVLHRMGLLTGKSCRHGAPIPANLLDMSQEALGPVVEHVFSAGGGYPWIPDGRWTPAGYARYPEEEKTYEKGKRARARVLRAIRTALQKANDCFHVVGNGAFVKPPKRPKKGKDHVDKTAVAVAAAGSDNPSEATA